MAAIENAPDLREIEHLDFDIPCERCTLSDLPGTAKPPRPAKYIARAHHDNMLPCGPVPLCEPCSRFVIGHAGLRCRHCLGTGCHYRIEGEL
jgi:hypothetical protein